MCDEHEEEEESDSLKIMDKFPSMLIEWSSSQMFSSDHSDHDRDVFRRTFILFTMNSERQDKSGERREGNVSCSIGNLMWTNIESERSEVQMKRRCIFEE